MENASKALLIAGAILICILLIGVGMMIYQGAIGNIEEGLGQMSQQEKMMFNEPYINYEGEKVSGNKVKALIGNAMSNNSTNQEIEGKLVSISIDGTEITATKDQLNTNLMSSARAKINTGATYTVVLEYSDAGLVNKAVITKNGSK
ncbi:MAG: hypothetical protein HFJ26_02680 [Clostridia bacterium]|nr:hypothetical protein [Clostridia bacterium]